MIVVERHTLARYHYEYDHSNGANDGVYVRIGSYTWERSRHSYWGSLPENMIRCYRRDVCLDRVCLEQEVA